MTDPAGSTISQRLDDLVRLEALVENTCTCGRGTDRAAHETPCPFAGQTGHLPEIPDDYRPQAYREGPRVDPWDALEISCGHNPPRLHDCPRCRSAAADTQLEAQR